MLGGMQYYFGAERRLVGIINAGEALDLPRAGLGIETLGVAAFGNGKRRINMHFNEWNARCQVTRAHAVAIGSVRADHANNGYDAGSRHQQCGFARAAHRFLPSSGIEPDAGVQAMTEIVAIEAAGQATDLQEAVFHIHGDRALTGATQAREPRSDAALTGTTRAECGVSSGGVPADIRVSGRIDGFLHGMHRRMVLQRAPPDCDRHAPMATLGHSCGNRIHPS